jgi:hypothetical protein
MTQRENVMPNYTWKNKETGEEHTNSMTMAEHDDYTKNNPHLEQVLRNFTVVDPVNIGVTKPPSDFQKYVLGRIKAAVPEASAVASKRWDIPKEI